MNKLYVGLALMPRVTLATIILLLRKFPVSGISSNEGLFAELPVTDAVGLSSVTASDAFTMLTADTMITAERNNAVRNFVMFALSFF